MIWTNPEKLQQFEAKKRIWQGIPGVEVTEKGRLFVTFYSGGVTEEIGNVVLLVKSDDGGETFSEPILAAGEDGKRYFDPVLWIDPKKRLWLTWSQYPGEGLYGIICDEPDAETLTWSEPFFIAHNIMMNKPIVTKDGRWLFPIAVWKEGVQSVKDYAAEGHEAGSFVYESTDEGKTFTRLGTPDVPNRHFDEHMLLEMQNGAIRNYVRTYSGISCADSFDGGRTFETDFDAGLGGPDSRFYIGRLKSGRVLLINHWHFKKRNNLYAMLSEDDGETFPYRLLLDERSRVSYPDVKEMPDGSIYVVYDRERGGYKKVLADAFKDAREILLAKITEEDIMAGSLVNPAGYLKKIATKCTSTGVEENG